MEKNVSDIPGGFEVYLQVDVSAMSSLYDNPVLQQLQHIRVSSITGKLYLYYMKNPR